MLRATTTGAPTRSESPTESAGRRPASPGCGDCAVASAPRGKAARRDAPAPRRRPAAACRAGRSPTRRARSGPPGSAQSVARRRRRAQPAEGSRVRRPAPLAPAGARGARPSTAARAAPVAGAAEVVARPWAAARRRQGRPAVPEAAPEESPAATLAVIPGGIPAEAAEANSPRPAPGVAAIPHRWDKQPSAPSATRRPPAGHYNGGRRNEPVPSRTRDRRWENRTQWPLCLGRDAPTRTARGRG